MLSERANRTKTQIRGEDRKSKEYTISIDEREREEEDDEEVAMVFVVQNNGKIKEDNMRASFS